MAENLSFSRIGKLVLRNLQVAVGSVSSSSNRPGLLLSRRSKAYNPNLS